MFSPEPDPTTITYFPMPPDPTWDWSGVGIDNELFQVNSDLDQNSDSTRSLFDPSKMIIAKVESLSEDSQFNDYLNEILESEEVIECLNSINTTSTLSVIDPPELLPAKESNESAIISSSEQTSTLAFEATPIVSVSTSITTTNTSSDTPTATAAAATTSEATLLPSLAVAQQSVESVAAYVAAETNLVPFTVQDCFTTTDIVDVTGSLAKVSDPKPLLSVVTRGTGEPCLVNMSSTVPAVSQHREKLKPESNVMWSQNTVETEPCLPEPAIKLPSPKRQQSTVSVLYDPQKVVDNPPPTKPIKLPSPKRQQSTVSDPQKVVDNPPPTKPIKLPSPKRQQSTVSDPQKVVDNPPPTKDSSAVVDVKTCAAKKKIVRIRRSKKAVEPTSTADARNTVGSQSNKKVKGQAGIVSTSIKMTHTTPPPPPPTPTPPQSLEPEVKSRNGRPIKPSWKVAESTSNQTLKRTISPITMQAKTPVKCTSSASITTLAKDKPKTIKLCRDRSDKSSLSLATVVGSSLKTLPDIPATPCSPNPTVSLPSQTAGLSMSLDDILRQMSEDEPQKTQALEFAESLLANVAPDEDSKENTTEEVVKKDIEKSKSTVRRIKVIKQMTNSSVEKDCPKLERDVDHSSIETKSHKPQPASEQLPQTSSTEDTLSFSVPTTQPLISLIDAGNSSRSTRIMMNDKTISNDEENCSQLSVMSDDEDCRTVMMDLCDSDTSQEMIVNSPIVKRLQEQFHLEQPSHEVGETSCHDDDGSDVGDKEVAEDEIEIFADDIDTFTVYTMDDRNTPPHMPSPPSELIYPMYIANV